MACGVPVIVGKNSSTPELLRRFAYMINDVYDEREIARALNTVLSDKQLQAGMRGTRYATHQNSHGRTMVNGYLRKSMHSVRKPARMRWKLKTVNFLVLGS